MRASVRHVRYTLTLDRPARVPQLRIAMLADLHACTRYMPLSRVEAIVDETQALGADLICLMGDYAGHLPFAHPLPPAPVADVLARRTAPLGVYAIFGNHDWRDDPAACAARTGPTKWHRAFDAAGIPTLCNAHITLDAGAPLTLAGIDSMRAFHTRFAAPKGMDDLPAALASAPPDQATILLAHEPDLFPKLPAHVDLTLSGHMHGGQIRPFGRALYAPSDYGTRYAYGHFVEGTRHLVVSGGLGYSGLPIRWGMPPELTIVELS